MKSYMFRFIIFIHSSILDICSYKELQSSCAVDRFKIFNSFGETQWSLNKHKYRKPRQIDRNYNITFVWLICSRLLCRRVLSNESWTRDTVMNTIESLHCFTEGRSKSLNVFDKLSDLITSRNCLINIAAQTD